MHIQSLVSPLLNLGRDVNRLVNDDNIVLQLSYTIARLEAELADSEVAGMALANTNEILGAGLYKLAGTLQDKTAEATQLRAFAEEHQSILEFGLDAAQQFIEEGCRADVQTRQAQRDMMEDVERKDRLLNKQAAQIKLLLQADFNAQLNIAGLQSRLVNESNTRAAHFSSVDNAANLKVAELEAQLVQVAAVHEEALKDVQHVQFDRDLAHSKTIAKQAAEITVLESKIEALKAGVLFQYQEVSDAHAKRERAAGETIASQATTIQNLHVTVHSLQAAALASKVADAAAINALSTVVEELKAKELSAYAARDVRAADDAKIIYKAKIKLKELKAVMEKSAAEAGLKDATVTQLEARVHKLSSDALDAATRTVANQLQATERLQAFEQRAVDAEEKAEQVLRKSTATVKTLAALHAKELAAARTRPATVTVDATMVDLLQTSADTDVDVVAQSPPAVAADVLATIPAPHSTVDFSLDCAFHFSTRFVVRAESAFAQASIAAPARFL
ncbi:hypothetical protein B0H17DRAFT_1049631 [Mycena rosella]|uniref:Uncharacterized protein n=1 Tax=Mycena rosella TaxID=1033263 RepID=A0AAD7DSR5_MYCRO|nr:hypothetical protein B0H17DRAFT_1049631 [Mycena rosella]